MVRNTFFKKGTPLAAAGSLGLTLVPISVLPNLWSFQASFRLVFMNIISNEHYIIICKINLKNQAKIGTNNLLGKTDLWKRPMEEILTQEVTKSEIGALLVSNFSRQIRFSSKTFRSSH